MNTKINIVNEGQAIRQTNYWNTEHAAAGLVFLSCNAGAARLLVPDAAKGMLSEMRGTKYVVISRGSYEGRDALELLLKMKVMPRFVYIL